MCFMFSFSVGGSSLGWNLPLTDSPPFCNNFADENFNGEYVPRSYSNYEIPKSQTLTSPKCNPHYVSADRDGIVTTDLTTHTQQNLLFTSNELKSHNIKPIKLDLCLNQPHLLCGGVTTNNATEFNNNYTSLLTTLATTLTTSTSTNTIMGNDEYSHQIDFPDTITACNNDSNTATVSALPDFVQDHWTDPWYETLHYDMQRISPPVSDNVNDLTEDHYQINNNHNHNNNNGNIKINIFENITYF